MCGWGWGLGAVVVTVFEGGFPEPEPGLTPLYTLTGLAGPGATRDPSGPGSHGQRQILAFGRPWPHADLGLRS